MSKTESERQLAKARKAFETVRKDKEGYTITTHAFYNLEGAILDIEENNGRCDRVSLATLKHVSKQLSRIGKALGL